MNVPGVGSMVKRFVPMLAVVALTVGCGGGTATPGASTPAPTSGPTAAATKAEATAATALVGTWVGLHTCERIVGVLRDAGMEGQILSNIVDNGLLPGVTDVTQVADPANPCVGAFDKEHSHFFTEAGLFGSLDFDGQQVDDGNWSLVDADTISINGTPFDFEVVGDELHLRPVDVGACPVNSTTWCLEAWKLMVAMPGMAWTRGS